MTPNYKNNYKNNKFIESWAVASVGNHNTSTNSANIFFKKENIYGDKTNINKGQPN